MEQAVSRAQRVLFHCMCGMPHCGSSIGVRPEPVWYPDIYGQVHA